MGFIGRWVNKGRSFVQQLLTTPGDQLGRWSRILRYQIDLWRHCIRRLRQNNSLAMSSALSYRTLFALVPILALSVVLMKSFGQWQKGEVQLRSILVQAGLDQTIVVPVDEPTEPFPPPTFDDRDDEPTDGSGNPPKTNGERSAPVMQEKKLTDVIMSAVTRVQRQLTIGKVGPVGVALLIWAAITLLTTLERSLNRIFGARSNRAIAQRFILYGSLITLWPIVLASAWYVGEKIQGLLVATPAWWLMALLGWMAPFFVGLLFVALVYKQLPNTRVSFRAALGGAAVAYPLWLVAKWGFGLYISEVVGAGGQGSLYGSMALLPVFLFWLNLTWTIMLFGAEVAHTGANLHKMKQSELAEKVVLGPLDRLAAALVVAERFVTCKGAATFDEISSKLGLPDQSVNTLLDQLMMMKVVEPVEHQNGPNRYILARPAPDVAVYDIMELAGHEGRLIQDRSFDEDIQRRIDFVRSRAKSCVGKLSMEEVIRHQE